LLAPRLILTPNSRRTLSIVVSVTLPAFWSAPTVRNQGIDDHILRRDAQPGSPFQDFSRNPHAYLRIGGNTTLVHRQPDHGCSIFLDER
jgi:hypothetical protein